MKIVTGMHRSGTSFICQVFDRLGADFGDPDLLFPADVWNQNGYFENLELIEVNNKIILGHQAKLDNWLKAPENLPGRIYNSFISMKWKYLLFPGPAGIHKRATHHHETLQNLHSVYSNTYVKDPRFCLTIGCWAEIGNIEQVVFSFRHPNSVAGSIKKREGLPLFIGYKYWLYHIQAFFRETPPTARIDFINFDAFFNPENQSREFDRAVRIVGKDVQPKAVDSIKETLDIHLLTQKDKGQMLPDSIAAAYEALLEFHELSKDGPVKIEDHSNLRARILG